MLAPPRVTAASGRRFLRHCTRLTSALSFPWVARRRRAPRDLLASTEAIDAIAERHSGSTSSVAQMPPDGAGQQRRMVVLEIGIYEAEAERPVTDYRKNMAQ